ncbi:FAD-dependent oxidoreductase [Actinoplanes bogorensis]|uniref:FAD-dependent oxidoreductase n=1 Tax=Paractinoplanes bogorensis TaxID=1610840 RepID=A0ABS5YXC1_9ACTN|nr:FAD-dependent oxidoreductase [Actinoplanes bogorensis]MBU2668087.1 FAD-dependent oxidoreductase [Actinoplanes bogorensis]
MNRIVVVGASAAGLAACETLRREGFEGTVTLIGAETRFPYDRPPLSKQLLAGAWDPSRLSLRSPAQIDALRLDARLGTTATGLSVADHTITLDTGPLAYDGLIIATGVRPRRLAGDQTHVLRTVEDALGLRERLGPGRRLAVVGAGFLGAEAAAVARGLGCGVVLFEPAPVPLAHAVGERVGRMLATVHEEHGVDLRTGVTVTSAEALDADEVLVAIGSQPNTEWLDGSGLRIDDGVVCDEYSAAAPDIYAAGDVARWRNPLFGVDMRVEHRTNATEQGMAAARNLLRPYARRPFAPVPYFWSDQYDLKLHAYGHLRAHDAVEIVDGSLEDRRFLAAYRRGDRLVGALAVGLPPKAVRPWRQAIADSALWKDVT